MKAAHERLGSWKISSFLFYLSVHDVGANYVASARQFMKLMMLVNKRSSVWMLLYFKLRRMIKFDSYVWVYLLLSFSPLGQKNTVRSN